MAIALVGVPVGVPLAVRGRAIAGDYDAALERLAEERRQGMTGKPVRTIVVLPLTDAMRRRLDAGCHLAEDLSTLRLGSSGRPAGTDAVQGTGKAISADRAFRDARDQVLASIRTVL